MLGTRDRTLLLDALRPPAGYRLRRAVGTSFTLDLMTLLTVPLAFTFYDAHDEDGAPVADPVALLEALRRYSEKIALFCQAGAISVPPPDQRLLAYLEGAVFEVQPATDGAIFHPKVWVLNFESGAGSVYRVLCLSRNLTFARSWDTCLRLEGQAGLSSEPIVRNQPIADFLRALPELTTRSVSHELREDLGRMAGEIERTDFRPPLPFIDFRVHNFGLGGHRPSPFPGGGRGLVVSPYLGPSTIRDLVRRKGLEYLVSRPEPMDEACASVGREALPRTCLVLSPGASLDSRSVQEKQDQKPDGMPSDGERGDLAGLHAKLYIFESGSEAAVFTGSANATQAAFQQNVEVLVELRGKRKDCGIDAFLGSDRDPSHATLRSLLQEYDPSDSPPEIDEAERLRIESQRCVDRTALALGAAQLTATVSKAGEGDLWDVTIAGKLPAIPPEIQVRMWPVTLSIEAALRLDSAEAGWRPEMADKAVPFGTIATFRGLSFEALTAFFAFELFLGEGRLRVQKRFAAAAKLVGEPANRKERLLRSLLQDRRRVLRLLFLVLMGEGADVSAFVQAAHSGGPASHGPFGNGDQATLLEALLRSLSRDPGRIDSAARLIADLRKTPEGTELLPEGLDEIWEPVWKARKMLET